MAVLALFAFDLTRAVGPPGDVVAVAADTPQGLGRLTVRAFEPWGDGVPADCEVVEVWRLRPDAPRWSGPDGQMQRVAVLRDLRWTTSDGELLDV